MTETKYSLSELGWRPFFQQQCSFEELEIALPARIEAVYRDHLQVRTESEIQTVPIDRLMHDPDPLTHPCAGDWILISREDLQPIKRLERLTQLSRTAAGSEPKPQLIGVNIDTLFIVTSCNADFNLSRLERYLAVAFEAHIPAVIVLTKADLSDAPEAFIDQAQSLRSDVPVLALNALDGDVKTPLSPWLGKGQMVAFVGSSGVGKSTLTNALSGAAVQDTAGIREDDAKGRHTTTGRSLHAVANGAWVLDTPGMRELRLNADDDGVSYLFEDIEDLMLHCKYRNCHHQGDAGCAITHALETGELDPRRWQNYQKLKAEAAQAALTKEQRKKQREAWGKDISKFSRQMKKQRQY